MKVTIAIGQDPSGKFSLLYLGDDVVEAMKFYHNPPKGTFKVAVFRKPGPFRSRTVAALAPAEAVVNNSENENNMKFPKPTSPKGPVPSQGSHSPKAVVDKNAKAVIKQAAGKPVPSEAVPVNPKQSK